MVRSNAAHEQAAVGFVENVHRATVAVSRARRGLYIFGNASNLLRSTLESRETWLNVVQEFGSQKSLGTELPLVCRNHGVVTKIKEPSDWTEIDGGCKSQCDYKCDSGHSCPKKCHPTGQDSHSCPGRCEKILACGHECRQQCGQQCLCIKRCGEMKAIVPAKMVKSTANQFPSFRDVDVEERQEWPKQQRRTSKVSRASRHKGKSLAPAMGVGNDSNRSSEYLSSVSTEVDTKKSESITSTETERYHSIDTLLSTGFRNLVFGPEE
jgi:hypothetical protein